MAHLIVLFAFAVAAVGVAARTPLEVNARNGRLCKAPAPQDRPCTGENPAGSAFSADIQRADGKAIASYDIVGVPGEMRTSPTYARWYATPRQAAMTTLTQTGTQAVRCGAPSTPASGLSLTPCRTPQLGGLALYQAFPVAGNGFVLVMRTAGATPAVWQRDAARASTASRAIGCNVPLKPSSFDYSTGWGGSGKSRRGKERGDADYSRGSGMENVHDPATGRNHWAEAGRDWRENAPRGPGHCANVNGEDRLLVPGRSN